MVSTISGLREVQQGDFCIVELLNNAHGIAFVNDCGARCVLCSSCVVHSAYLLSGA